MAGCVFVFAIWNLFVVSKGTEDAYQFYHDHVTNKLQRETPDGAMGNLLKYPELTMEPSLEGHNNAVIFRQGDKNSFVKYTDRLKNVFNEYNIQENRTKDCTNITGYGSRDSWDDVCRFDPMVALADPGDLCSSRTNYGFSEGLPCIVLGFDRIHNWIPEAYSNTTIPDNVKDVWTEGHIAVTCEGTDHVSIDNLYHIETVPKDGFPYKYFPNMDQSEWRTPLVQIVAFTAIGVAVEIRCTVWADNIEHNDLLSTGSVKFTILGI